MYIDDKVAVSEDGSGRLLGSKDNNAVLVLQSKILGKVGVLVVRHL